MGFNGMYQPMGMPAYPMPPQMGSFAQPDPMRQGYGQMNQALMNPAMNVQVQPQQDPGMIWVQGEAGAKAFMVAPGNSAVLWDSEANVIYIKSADANGMPYMRVFDYSERNAMPRNVSSANANGQRFVTWDEFSRLEARFEQMIKPVSGGEENEHAE